MVMLLAGSIRDVSMHWTSCREDIHTVREGKKSSVRTRWASVKYQENMWSLFMPSVSPERGLSQNTVLDRSLVKTSQPAPEYFFSGHCLKLSAQKLP